MKIIKIRKTDDIKDKMKQDYEDLIQRLKTGEVLSKQDLKFIQSYQSINNRPAFNAGKRKNPNITKQRITK